MPAIRTAAQPLEFNFNQTFPWALAPGNAISSTGAATVAAVSQYTNGFKFGAAAVLQTANQLGPLTFGYNSIKSATVQQAPNGAQPATANITDLDQWQLGLAGLANTTGAIGFVENAAAYDPFVGTHAGFLQTNNNLGPAFFNLNVLKAIGLTQAPSGTLLSSGQPDDYSAVDIGRWSAGIPGLITNTGTTGFVFSADFGNGPINTFFVGGLHTTTTIGSMVFDFNFLPTIRTSIFPPGLTISLSPDMTAAETEFAAITPPPPGTIDPPVTNPLPLALKATPPTQTARSVASTQTISGPPPADTETDATTEPVTTDVKTEPATDVATDVKTDATEAPKVETTPATEVSDTKPKVEIPGVNGVPLTGTPSAGTTSGGGGGAADPFKPFRSIADSIKSGIENFTGTGARPAVTSGAGSESAGGSTTSGGASTGSSGGSDKSDG
ncbi:hypothetical protein CIW49_01985 [Mycolicibacterium sp. P1-18]|uniref:hypothetical protein n=1 Tax=Mycolicibacterium sp. P1-18 TaxID=2024615 RepID=UPI0011F327F4|nr:hypothetical protein [Mycolicibacterium sp. P1-18]KAA0102125.1 hypothetical protein CIW49_01985 [Mycolicibacterium sp. P1-18]